MSFPQKIKDELMVASARHCCVCHRYKGVKLEIHHIVPKTDEGEDTYENGIVLCFDCHADAGHYFSGHPKGTKFSPGELRKHKEGWFKKVQERNIPLKSNSHIRVLFENNKESITIRPIFKKIQTEYRDVEELKKMDWKKFVDDRSETHHLASFMFRQIKTFDDFVKFINGELLEKYPERNQDEEKNPQPVLFDFSMTGGTYSYTNQSICQFKLKVSNDGTDTIDDLKLRLDLSEIPDSQIVDTRKELLDSESESNLHFEDTEYISFIPQPPNHLLANDYVISDAICFKPKTEDYSVKLKWEIYSRTTRAWGELKINITPFFEVESSTKYVQNPSEHKSYTEVKSKLEFD